MPQKALVSLVKGEERRKNIIDSLRLIEKDLSLFKRARRVLIKPNFTSAFNPTACTTGESVEALLEFLITHDQSFHKKEVFLAETSGEALQRGVPMKKVFTRFGFDKIFLKHHHIKMFDMVKSKQFVSVEIETLSGEKTVRIPSEFFSFDYKISITPPKTHDTVVITAGVKNFLMGIIKPEDKYLMHGALEAGAAFEKINPQNELFTQILSILQKKAPWQLLLLLNNAIPGSLKNKMTGFEAKTYLQSVICLNQNLFYIGKKIMPDLVVIDGFIGMEGDGPVYGRRKKLGIAIASTDGVKADGIAARVMGFNPQKIGYLWLLANGGKGNLSTDNLVGEEIKIFAGKFQPHSHYKQQKQGNNLLVKEFLRKRE